MLIDIIYRMQKISETRLQRDITAAFAPRVNNVTRRLSGGGTAYRIVGIFDHTATAADQRQGNQEIAFRITSR